MALSAEERRQRARRAALKRWAFEDPVPNAKRGQDGLLERFAREVDPTGVLPENERITRAKRLRREHMIRLSAKGVAARQADQ